MLARPTWQVLLWTPFGRRLSEIRSWLLIIVSVPVGIGAAGEDCDVVGLWVRVVMELAHSFLSLL